MGSQVIFDGECPICIGLKGFVEDRTDEGQLNFIPYQSDTLADIAPGISKKQVSQSLHMVTENAPVCRSQHDRFGVMCIYRSVGCIRIHYIDIPETISFGSEQDAFAIW